MDVVSTLMRPHRRSTKSNHKMKLPKFLAIVAAAAVSTGLQAAKITYEVQVPGYSRAGWVKIVPELRGALRGGVAYLPQHGGWVTDRVGRGEMLRTTFVADRSGERSGRGALVGIASPKGVINFSCTRIGYSLTERVSRDARLDNIFAWAITEAGYFEKRVPVGTR